MDFPEYRTNSLELRFWAKVNKSGPVPDYRPDLGPCWVWVASVDRKGYGNFHVISRPKKSAKAHRVSYELLVGPVMVGLEIDHLCRVRHCVNPAHLEAVTPYENMVRGNSLQAQNLRKTHCPKGHEYTEENIYRLPGRSARYCLACHAERTRLLQQKNRLDPENLRRAREYANGHYSTYKAEFVSLVKNPCVDCGKALSSYRPSRCNPCAQRHRRELHLVDGLPGVPYNFP